MVGHGKTVLKRDTLDDCGRAEASAAPKCVYLDCIEQVAIERVDIERPDHRRYLLDMKHRVFASCVMSRGSARFIAHPLTEGRSLSGPVLAGLLPFMGSN
mgnify:CR=1